jgi:probable O-glycosylation ligase (exosortase A-associated)
MRDIVVVSLVLWAAFVSLRRPVVGLLTFAFLGFFSPQSYTWSFGRTIPLSMIVAITTIAGLFISPEPKKWPAQREMIILILLWLTFGLSTVFAIYPDRAYPELIGVSKILLMVVLATVVINTKERLDSLFRVIGYSLGFYGFKCGVSSVIGGGDFLVYGPELSFLQANNSIGLALAMNIPFLYYLYRSESNKWLRRMAQAMMLFSVPGVLFTYSRGAWLGMLMAIALLFLRAKRKFLIVTAAAVVAASLSSVLPRITPAPLIARYDQLVHYEKDESAESRFWNWEFCRRVGTARLTGGGFWFESQENYAKYYPEFQQRFPGKSWTCHSAWFTMLGDHGVLGLTLWVALIVSSLMSLRRLRLIGQMAAENSWLILLSQSVQTAFVVFMVIGTFLDAGYFDLFYYLVAIVVIAKGLVDAIPVKALETSLAPIAARSGLQSPTFASTNHL